MIMKKTAFVLLIFCTVIDIFVCEVIEIKGPTETRHPNVSAILNTAILHTYTDSLKYSPISEDPLNLTFIPWPITRILSDKNQASNFEDSADSANFLPLPVTKKPKSLYKSENLPSRIPEERCTRIFMKRSFTCSSVGTLVSCDPSCTEYSAYEERFIPTGQSMYPDWDETSVKSTRTRMDNNKSHKAEIHNTATAHAKERRFPLVPTQHFRHSEEERKNKGINRQYLGYDESNHSPKEYYASMENEFLSPNFEPENTDTYAQNYFSQSGRFGLENYDSYSTGNYKHSPNRYSENPDRRPLRHPCPNSAYSQFTVDPSYNDVARGGPSSSLISIFLSIGSNLLQLFKIGLGSGLSIAIPIIAVKLFLIPLKILKFIKIIKILLKLIFVVPFVLRLFSPSLYSAIGNHDIGFGNKMGEVLSPDSRVIVDQTSENSSWWNSIARNLSSALPDLVSSQECPSRVACELGSYLASTSKIPEKLTKFLAKEESQESKDFNEEQNKKQEVTRAFLRALTQRWTYDRCNIFVCGISF